MEDITAQILACLQDKDYQSLRSILTELHPADVADILEELREKERVVVFRLLKKDVGAEVFAEMEGEKRQRLVALLNTDLLMDILEEMDFDDKIDFLEEMPANFVTEVLHNESTARRALINKFLKYPEDSAGSLMTIEFMELQGKWTAKEALVQIKKTGKEKVITNCYVLDAGRVLEGVVGLSSLVLAKDDELVEEMMVEEVIYGLATDDQESMADKFAKYDIVSVPIVDKEKRLLGVVTVDDIVDVIEEEATEDMQKMAAMTPSDVAYLETSVWSLTKQRIGWLLVLMIGATSTAGIIAHYEGLLSAAVILTAFIPLLMDSGGNAGSQAATLVIRGMAIEEIKLGDWWKVLWKELRVSVMCGVLLALVNLGRMLILNSANLAVCMAVSLTLLLTVVMAKVVGAALPLLAKLLRIDPAVMAGPMITTIVDVVVLFIYFALAQALVI